MTAEAKTLPWMIDPEQFTYTDHQITIERTLSSIKSDRHSVILFSDNYQSKKAVLNRLDANNILINRPEDWQESISSAKIFFLDTFKVWNFFQVTITRTTPELIYTDIPKRIHRLQRRRHFRISPPTGCQVSFKHDDQLLHSILVNDISAGGILISTDAHESFPEDVSRLNEIKIRVPTHQDGTGTYFHLPEISKGKIVRSYKDQSSGKTFFAIAFSTDFEVKDEISKYVIQREQEILRQNLRSGKPL